MRYLLPLLTVGCGSFDTGSLQHLEESTGHMVSYAWDTSCTTTGRDMIVSGFLLWTDLGELVVESDRPDVVVCPVVEPLSGGQYGSTVWGETVHMNVRIIDWIHAMTPSVAAHELGHVILGSGDHLPQGQTGIMSANLIYDSFTEADFAFLEAHGFTTASR